MQRILVSERISYSLSHELRAIWTKHCVCAVLPAACWIPGDPRHSVERRQLRPRETGISELLAATTSSKSRAPDCCYAQYLRAVQMASVLCGYEPNCWTRWLYTGGERTCLRNACKYYYFYWILLVLLLFALMTSPPNQYGHISLEATRLNK